MGYSADQKAIVIYEEALSEETMILHTGQQWNTNQPQDLYYLTEPKAWIEYDYNN